MNLVSNEALFYFSFIALVLVVVGLWRLVHSPFGRILYAVKQNEMRAAFVGHDVWLYKWLAFVISAAIAGLAGALFAMAQQSAYPNVMSLHSSGFVVMMVLIGGGLVSFWGPVDRCGVLHPCARPPRRVHRDVAPLGTASPSWRWCCSSPEGMAGIWQSLGGRPR